jgi:hypothetical protein
MTNKVVYDERHGSPYDRGAADSYYRRPKAPHKWLDNCGRNRVELTEESEIEAYLAGFDDNEQAGVFKDYI